MQGVDRYWLDGRDGPFATFLSYVQSYYHPEVRYDNFSTFVEYARKNPVDDPDLLTFKHELVRLLRGEHDGLDPMALSVAAEYDDFDSDDEFLAWLWHELYPDEALPTPKT
ncbi:hypothetical protein ACFV9C_06915 [Kribbella sp. NPDC059898]|uniref:hypothetical protein n=1 Tax=Kribbella sp. NPDC059898 TaxID=3346995 RepID=UPI00364C46E2